MGQHYSVSLTLKPHMESLFAGVSGFGMHHSIENMADTVNTTYGELTFEGAQELLDELKLSSRDVFVDVGCGIGKLVFHAAMASQATVVGIEVARGRYEQAVSIWGDDRVGLFRNRVKLWYGDASTFDISMATVLYMCSTCFPPGLTDTMVAGVRPGTVIVAATPLSGPLKLIKNLVLDCSWHKGVLFYIYMKQDSPDF